MNKLCEECSVQKRGLCKGKEGNFNKCFRKVGHLDLSTIKPFDNIDELYDHINDTIYQCKPGSLKIKPYYGNTKLLIGEISGYSGGEVPIGYVVTNQE